MDATRWRFCWIRGSSEKAARIAVNRSGSRSAPDARLRETTCFFAFCLEGDVATEISKAGSHYFTDEVLIQNILDVAKKNEVRLKREDVKVERLAGQVQVSFQYTVPVDLIIFQHTFEFKVKASSYVGTL